VDAPLASIAATMNAVRVVFAYVTLDDGTVIPADAANDSAGIPLRVVDVTVPLVEVFDADPYTALLRHVLTFAPDLTIVDVSAASNHNFKPGIVCGEKAVIFFIPATLLLAIDDDIPLF
jgi:hypothetical protein